MATSRRSPRLWPRLSLTTLKWSRSRNSTATRRWWRRARIRARSETLDQQRPVGQAGERIVGGLVGQPMLERLALAQVVHDDRVEDVVVLGVAVAQQLRPHRHDPALRSVEGHLTRPRTLGVHHRQDLGGDTLEEALGQGVAQVEARWSRRSTPRKRRAAALRYIRSPDRLAMATRSAVASKMSVRRCISRWDCLRSVMSSIAPMAPLGTPSSS